jgi:hypothetical protein
MPRRVPDLAKIGGLIGYRPTRTLDQILEDVIAFAREHADLTGETQQAPTARQMAAS